MQGANDSQGVGEDRVAFDKAVQGARIVDKVNDVDVCEDNRRNRYVDGHGGQQLALPNEGVLAVQEGKVVEADISGGVEKTAVLGGDRGVPGGSQTTKPRPPRAGRPGAASSHIASDHTMTGPR